LGLQGLAQRFQFSSAHPSDSVRVLEAAVVARALGLGGVLAHGSHERGRMRPRSDGERDHTL
jgi:hypothetical protein